LLTDASCTGARLPSDSVRGGALDSKGSYARYYTESLVDEFDFTVAYEVLFGWFVAFGLR